MHGTFDPGDIHIGFWFSGFDDAPERVSELLDLDADYIVRRGQCFPPPRAARERAAADHWGLQPEPDLPATLPARLALGDLVRPLRTALAGRVDRLAALAGCVARIDIVIATDGPAPALTIRPGDLDFLDGAGLAVALGVRNVAAGAATAADIAIPAFPGVRPVDIRELAPV